MLVHTKMNKHAFNKLIKGGATQEEELKIAPGAGTSYDDLRQRNRDEYAKKRANPYYRLVTTLYDFIRLILTLFLVNSIHRPIDGEQPPPINRPPPSAPRAAPEEPSRPKKKNQYGDDWVE